MSTLTIRPLNTGFVPTNPFRFQSLVCTGTKFKAISTPELRIEPMLVITWLPKFAPIGVSTLFSKSSVVRRYQSTLPPMRPSRKPKSKPTL